MQPILDLEIAEMKDIDRCPLQIFHPQPSLKSISSLFLGFERVAEPHDNFRYSLIFGVKSMGELS